jgi:hypothetical protein
MVFSDPGGPVDGDPLHVSIDTSNEGAQIDIASTRISLFSCGSLLAHTFFLLSQFGREFLAKIFSFE